MWVWRCVVVKEAVKVRGCGRSCDRCVREFNKHRCVLTLARIRAHAAWHSSAVCPLTSTFCQSTLFPRAVNDILSDLGHCSCNAPKSCSFSSLLHSESVKMCQIQPVKMAPPTKIGKASFHPLHPWLWLVAYNRLHVPNSYSFIYFSAFLWSWKIFHKLPILNKCSDDSLFVIYM